MKVNYIQKIILILAIIPTLAFGIIYDETRIVVDEGSAGDMFGYTMAASTDRIIVGAPGFETGTNNNSGAAYVFDKIENSWTFQQRLETSKPKSFDHFGSATVYAASSLFISAPAFSNIDGMLAGEVSGTVYQFDYDDDAYTQTTTLVPSPDDRQNGDLYGMVLSTNMLNFLAVGAPRHNLEATADAGAVYIFKQNQETWEFFQKITASDPETGALFGCSIAMDSSRMVIGAKSKDFADPAKEDAGAVYFFSFNGENWTQDYKYPEATTSLPANFTGFGQAVSIFKHGQDNETVVVGNPATASTTGSVYVFNNDGSGWSQVSGSPFIPDGLETNTWWGQSVFIYGNNFIGGDYVNGDHGAVIQYKYNGSNWGQDRTFTPATAQTGGEDQFGYYVETMGIDDNWLYIGAPNGAGGDGGSTANAGAVYLYNVQPLDAAFTADRTEGPAAMRVQFTDQSAGDPTGWEWTFGDGSTSNEQNPVHYYTAPGVVYDVQLTVTRGQESDTYIARDYITTTQAPEYNNWTQVHIGTGLEDNLYDVQVIDENTAFAVGGFTTGKILKSTDNGFTWYPTAAASKLNSVFFRDAENGYAVGKNGLFMSTSNTGENWSSQTLLYEYNYTDVWFTDSNTGYLVGDNLEGSDTGGWVLKTTNGGEDWTQVSAEKNVLEGNPLFSLYFLDADTGYAVGGKLTISGVIYKTTNAGETWEKIHDSSMNLNDVWFTSASTGYATGYNGTLLTTTNYGATWTDANNTSNTNNFNAVDFVDNDNGYIVTSDHELLTTVNAAESWQLDDFEQLYQEFTGVDIHTSGTGFIVGEYGLILRDDTPPPLLASFSAAPVTGTTPLETSFTDQSVGNVVSWLWNFGDGTTDDSQNPTHIYKYPGVYSVTLTVGDGISQSTSTRNSLISARAVQPQGHAFYCISPETMFGTQVQMSVNQMAFNPFDTTIVVATSDGVTEYSGIFWRHYDASNNVEWPQVNAVAIDSSGNKWFGLTAGVRVFSAKDTTSYNPTESTVNDIYVHADDDIWLATDNGLANFDGETWTVYNTSNSDLAHNQVNRVTRVPDYITDGTEVILASTNGGGISVFEPAENSWSVINAGSGLPDNVVYNVVFDKVGNAWITCANGGIVKMNTDTEDMTVYTPFDDGDNGLAFSAVGIDSSGNVWAAGTHSGLARYDGIEWVVYNVDDTEFCSDMIRAKNILVEPWGTTWFGTQDAGMVRRGVQQENGVDFYANVTAGYPPLNVRFYGYASGGTPTYWAWDFDDDGSLDVLNEQSPTFTFDDPGYYTIKLFAPFGADNQERVRYHYIHVLDEDTTKGDIKGYITDATTGNGVPGATVSIGGLSTTTDSEGYYVIQDVDVTDLIADFTGTPRTGQDSLNVQFTDLSAFGRLLLSVSADGYTSFSSLVNLSTTTTTYNVSLSPTIAEGGMRLVLSWDDSPADLDIYLSTPEVEGTEYLVYYNSKGSFDSPPYAQLDLDDTDGYGPETITMYQRSSGTYKCYIHNYSGSPELTESTGQVRIYNESGLFRTIEVPASGEGDYWYVCDIDGETGAVTEVNSLSSSAPSAAMYRAQRTASEKPASVAASHKLPGIYARPINSWSWDFDNDGQEDANVQHPTHKFTPGIYDVKLTVSDGELTDSILKESYITVSQSGSRFSGYVTDAVTGNGIEGAKVKIANDSTTTDGDGFYEFEAIPIGEVTADFTATPRAGGVPLTVQFVDQSVVGKQHVVITADGYYGYDDYVEIDDEGTTLNVSLSPEIPEGHMRVVLTWGDSPNDLDLHMIVPENNGSTYEIDYNNKGSNSQYPMAALDIDDTQSYGPETITMYDRYTGTYKVYIHNYSGSPDITTSGGTVQVFGNTGLLETIRVPLQGTGAYWNVCEIDGETGAVTVVNTVTETRPSGSSFNPNTADAKPQIAQLAKAGSGYHGVAAIETWQWDFDNNGTVDATTQNPEYTYATPGTYAVRLKVSNGVTNDVEIKQEYITVTGSLGTVSGYVTDAVTGDSLENVTVVIDGKTTTTDANGYYEIDNIPFSGVHADFYATPRTGDAPLLVQFQDRSTANAQNITVSADGYYDFQSVVEYNASGAVYNVTLSPEIDAGQMRVVLSWGEAPSDMDLHLLTPEINGSTYEIDYNNKGNASAAPWAELDIDDTSSYGPETITIYDQFAGTYRVFVHNYSGSPATTTSDGKVQIFGDTGIIESIQVPATGDGNYWYVCDINGETGGVTIVNTLGTSKPNGTVVTPGLASKSLAQAAQHNRGQQTHAVTSWQWDFNNDGTIDATTQNPLYTLNAAGSFDVKLTVSDGVNSDSELKEDYITTVHNGVVVSGYVTDAVNGNAIAGATVTIGDSVTTTNSDGFYSISDVQLGALTSDFYATPRSGNTPLSVQFRDISYSNAQRIIISKGDDYYQYSELFVVGSTDMTYSVSLSPKVEEGQMRLVLTWGDQPSDLDIHLMTPDVDGNSYEIDYNSKGSSTAPPWVELDIDDTSSYGPETITIYKQYAGTYKLFVHNYSGSPVITTSSATIQIFGDTGLLQTVNVPVEGDGNYWYVADIDGNTGNIELVNTINATAPQGVRFKKATAAAKPEKTQTRDVGPYRTHNVLSWAWDFNNDGTVDATTQNPEHTYTAPGYYSVKLTVSDGLNSSSELKSNYINVSGYLGSISGYVTDAVTGEAIRNAVVTIAGKTTTTDSLGFYIITQIPTGELQANFSAAPRSGDSPLLVQFQDYSASSAQLLSVNAGDGYYTYEALAAISQGGTQRNVTLSPRIGEGQMRVVLSWGEYPEDMDLHMLTPEINGSTYELYWSNMGSQLDAPFAMLDIDDMNGIGPETITIYNVKTGTYKIFVHNFSGVTDLTQSGGTVQLFDDTGLRNTIQVPTTGDGRYWYVCKIDGQTGQVVVVNSIQTGPPSGALQKANPSLNKPMVDRSASTDTDGGITSWQWDFNNDGSIDSYEQNPLFTYSAPGMYSVSLTVSDGDNTNTKLRQNYISVFESTDYARYQVVLHGIDHERFPNINLYATVVDTNSNSIVTDLQRADISSLLENSTAHTNYLTPSRVTTNQPTKMDVVFVFDKSVNMVGALDVLQAQYTEIAAQLAQNGVDYRFGLVSYGQDVSSVGALTSDLKQFSAYLSSVQCIGSADKSNALPALVAAAQMNYRNYASKAIVLISLNDFYVAGDGNYTTHTAASVGLLLRNAGVVAHVTAPKTDGFMDIAHASGGLFYEYTTGLADLLSSISSVMSTQYVIKYTSNIGITAGQESRNVRLDVDRSNEKGYGTGQYKVGTSRLVFEPSRILGLQNKTVTFNIKGESLANVDVCYMSLEFDTTALKYLDYSLGDFLTQDGVSLDNPYVNVVGNQLVISLDRQANSGQSGVYGSGNLISLRFQIQSTSSNTAPITFNSFQVRDQAGNPLSVQTQSPSIQSPYANGASGTSLMSGDFDDDLDIDTRDFALFSTYWGNGGSGVAGDIGPASGEAPFLTTSLDDTVKFDDLFVFTEMWNWYHETIKNTGVSLGKSSHSIEWNIAADIEEQRDVQIAVQAKNLLNLGMGHLLVKYDPSALQYSSASAGELFSANGTPVALFATEIAPGLVDLSVSRLAKKGTDAHSSGSGGLVTLNFERVNLGQASEVTIVEADLRTPENMSFLEMSDIRAEVAGMKLPRTFALSHNYPNPFNNRTSFQVSLPRDAHVELTVYNVMGQQVRVLLDGNKQAGEHKLTWNGQNNTGRLVSSGIYFVQMKSGDFKQVRQILFLK